MPGAIPRVDIRFPHVAITPLQCISLLAYAWGPRVILIFFLNSSDLHGRRTRYSCLITNNIYAICT